MTDKTVAHLREVIREPELAHGRYRALDQIGRGGMGTVYRAEDAELDREVALKVLKAESEMAVERMRREARILARLEHPGIVPIHDVGILDDGRAFYVMKLVRGQRLDRYQAGAHSMTDRLRLFARLCEPIGFAHARGIVHRDLKPENVMVGEFGEVLVLDWGVAKVAGEAETIAVAGTRAYMAPEQAADPGCVDGRADVYALGKILRFLIEADGAPKPLLAICAQATAEKPGNRYQSALELSRDVERFLDGLAVDAYPETLADRAYRFYAKYKLLIALIVAYLVMRGVIILWTRH